MKGFILIVLTQSKFGMNRIYQIGGMVLRMNIMNSITQLIQQLPMSSEMKLRLLLRSQSGKVREIFQSGF